MKAGLNLHIRYLMKLPALLTAFSIMLLMCSCSLDKNTSADAGDESVRASESRSMATEKTSDKPVQLTMFSTVPGGHEKEEDNEIREIIAGKTGVQVLEVWLEGQNCRNVIDSLLENNNITDYLYVNERLDEFYEHGMLVAWDDYIEKYPNIRNLYTEEEWDLLRQADGHIYSVNIPGGPAWPEDIMEGRVVTNKAGFAVTTCCKDPDTAFRFINDILSEEILELRFWGIEGVDYLVNVDGSYYRTREMNDNWNDKEYGIKHVCSYTLMPGAGILDT